MNRKERDEARDLQGQWLFVVLGSLLAIFFGVAVNALYELLKDFAHTPIVMILFIFGGLGILFADMFLFFFENLMELRKEKNNTMWSLFSKYLKARIGVRLHR